MAVTPGQRNQLKREAQGWVAQQAGEWAQLGLQINLADVNPGADWLKARHPEMDGLDTRTARDIVRREIRANRAAARMVADPWTPTPLNDIPRDPGIRADQPRIRYDVVVTYVGPDGENRTARVPVRSNVPLSADEISAAASDLIDLSEYPRIQARGYIAAGMASGEISVQVIAVSRR